MKMIDPLIRFLRHPLHEHSNGLHEIAEHIFQGQMEDLALLRHGLVDLAAARRRYDRQPARRQLPGRGSDQPGGPLEGDTMLAEEERLTGDVHRLEAEATRFRTLTDPIGPTWSANDARHHVAETAARIAEEMSEVDLAIKQTVAGIAGLEQARARSGSISPATR